MEIDQHTLEIRDKILQSMLANKQSLVKRYGSEAEKVLYGKSMKGALKQVAKEKEKLRETIKQCLTKPTQKITEKLDNKGDEWEDPYKEYEKKIYDYEPTQDEIDKFKRIDKGLPPPQPPQSQIKREYTGWAYLEYRKDKISKWETIKYGPNKVIYGEYYGYIKRNPGNKNRFRVVPEIK